MTILPNFFGGGFSLIVILGYHGCWTIDSIQFRRVFIGISFRHTDLGILCCITSGGRLETMVVLGLALNWPTGTELSKNVPVVRIYAYNL